MSKTDPRLVLLNAADNVAVARCTIDAGTHLSISGQEIILSKTIKLGHKLARASIGTGEKVLKYGVPIGSATANIAAGEHVHLHNMKSDYTASYALTEDGKRV